MPTTGKDRKVLIFLATGAKIPTVDMEPIKGDKGKNHKITWTIDKKTLPNVIFDYPAIRIWDSKNKEITPNDSGLFHDPSQAGTKLTLINENPVKEAYYYELYLSTGAVVKTFVPDARAAKLKAKGRVKKAKGGIVVDPTMDNEGF